MQINLEITKEQIKRALDPLNLDGMKNALRRFEDTEANSSDKAQAINHMTESEYKEYQKIIQEFDMKRHENALQALYKEAKEFVALYETRD